MSCTVKADSYRTDMGRRRKAWLWSKTGKRVDRGRRLPGYYVRLNDYSSGKMVGRSVHFLSLQTAKEYVRTHNARSDLKLLGRIIPRPLVDVAAEFASGLTGLADNTILAYEIALGMLVGTVGNRNVSTITGVDIDNFVADRLKKAGRETAAKHLRHLGRFFNWCVKQSYVAANPIKYATAPPKGMIARIRPPISNQQLARLVDALDSDCRKVAVLIAVTTGLDRAVITGLTPAQIDIDHKCIRLQRPKTQRRTKRLVVPTIHDGILPWIAARCSECGPRDRILSGLARQEKGEDWWHLAAKAAGVPDLLFRDLRAIATTRLIDAGVPLARVQQMLGHSDPKVTAGHYITADPELAKRLNTLPLPCTRPLELSSES